tara:strand:+ start:168 stop:479 length:312 start_codon:yes stop_codon:yes gene_type:complete
MKKFFFATSIFVLILLTAIIKNSTKEIEDKIFTTKENIRILRNEFGILSLEFNYLSSSEKLLNYQTAFFDKELEKKNLGDIKIIKKNKDKVFIKNFKLFEKDD